MRLFGMEINFSGDLVEKYNRYQEISEEIEVENYEHENEREDLYDDLYDAGVLGQVPPDEEESSGGGWLSRLFG